MDRFRDYLDKASFLSVQLWNIFKVLYAIALFTSFLWVFFYSLIVGVAPPVVNKTLFMYLTLYFPLSFIIFFFFLLILFFLLLLKPESCSDVIVEPRGYGIWVSLMFSLLLLAITATVVYKSEISQSFLRIWTLYFIALSLSLLFSISNSFEKLTLENFIRSIKKVIVSIKNPNVGSNLKLDEDLKRNLCCLIAMFFKASSLVFLVVGEMAFSLFVYLSRERNMKVSVVLILIFVIFFLIHLLLPMVFLRLAQLHYTENERKLEKNIKKQNYIYVREALAFIFVFFLTSLLLTFTNVVAFPFYLSGLGFREALLFKNEEEKSEKIFLLWRLSNWIAYQKLSEVKEKKGIYIREIPSTAYVKIIPTPFLELPPQPSSSSSSQQRANSQPSKSQRTSGSGHQNQIPAQKRLKGPQGRWEKQLHRNLSSHRKKTSEQAESEKKRQSKTYTGRQPDTAGQRE